MSKLVVKKGYTLEVVSWENDADHYSTERMVFDNENEALAVRTMCEELFCSGSNQGTGIGNMRDSDYDRTIIIINKYIENHPEVVEVCLLQSSYDLDNIVDMVMDYNYDLLGSSEDYCSRVCESAELYYSDKDIYLETL